MANQEGVDIIIKATDQYTATINKIAASNKLFGQSVEGTQKQISALEKYMVTLVANGIDPADKKIVQLKNDYDKLNQTMNSGQGSLKDANKKWTSLALVVQDLPYGFRGIQNNLPALFGSIAAAAGPAYFAFSALVAIVTAYEKEIRALFVTTSAAEKQQELLNNVVKASGTAFVDAETEVISLTQKVKLAKEGYLDKQSVIDDYNKTIGETIGEQKTLEGVNQALINQGPAYVDYMNKMAMAVAASKLVAQETENIIRTTAKSTSEFVSVFEGFISGKLNLGGMVPSMIASSEAALKVGEKNKKSQLTTAEQTRVGYVKIMEDMYKAAGEAAKKAGVVAGGKKDKPKEDTYLKDFANSLKEEEKLFKDNLSNQLSFAEGNDAKKVEILGKAMSDLIAWHNQGIIEESFYQNTLAELYRQTYNLKAGLLRDEQNEKDKIAKENEQIENRQLQNSLDALKIESDVAMKIANLSGNANASDRIKILEDYKNGLYELASVGGYTAEQYDKLDDAIRRVDGAIEGSKDRVKNYTVTWQETVNTINGILNNLDISLLTNFGEQIGNMLAGGKFDISQMGSILADALSSIGKALIAYAITNGAVVELFKNPKTWPLALAAGIAAVAAGTALKSKISNNKATAFANGGIVSGPTMGLVGEYPGAQNNPEVIAPLDKLKEMIGGGGGGTFVLRGQDLLLSVNRAQKASNLKGQNISLA
jgi:hypothetical protein